MQDKPFLTPADVADALDVSTTTVLRKIHAGEIPAIVVSERIHQIPAAGFERYVSGSLRVATRAPLGERVASPRIGSDEALPNPHLTISREPGHP